MLSNEPDERSPADQRGIRRRTILGGGLAALAAPALVRTAEAGTPAAPAIGGVTDVTAAAWPDPPNGYPEWNNNIGIFQVNAQPPHATLMPYADLQQALAADRSVSPFRLDLTGTWKCMHVSKPAGRDLSFWRTDVDDSGWATLLGSA